MTPSRPAAGRKPGPSSGRHAAAAGRKPAADHAGAREGRRLAFGAIFEADFGHRTAKTVLERRLEDEGASEEAAAFARSLVDAVMRHRDSIDAVIGETASAWPVVQLARIDRALLRSGVGELLHCPTPARVTISEWVGLARTYSGEPARRLLNGVLGRVADRDDTTVEGSIGDGFDV
ncbi:MAG: transcription antitermination factor NusB [Candidatus Limnocylindrales bacterium]